MNVERSHARQKPQTGFSLLELLVGLMIGLLALSASLQAFQALSLNQHANAQIMRLDNDARQLLNSIALQIQEAGSTSIRAAAAGTVSLFDIDQSSIQVDDSGGIQMHHFVAHDARHEGCLHGLAGNPFMSWSTYVLGEDQTLRCNPTSDASVFPSYSQPLMDKVKELSWQFAVANGTGLRWLSAIDATEQGLIRSVIGVHLCAHLIGPESTFDQSTSPKTCDGSVLSKDGQLHVVRARTIWMAGRRP